MSSKRQVAVGVDAGSARTRCAICFLEGGRLRYAGHGETPSKGFTKGRITDQAALSESIRNAVQMAEQEAGVSVDGVVVGMGGSAVSGTNSRGLYEFGRPRDIEADDLGYAVERATHVRLEDDRMILQVFPQDFIVDGRAGYRNPRGALCSRLEANVHVVTVSVQDHQCLVNAVNQAHLMVEETVFEPMAAAYAAVLAEDRSRGVAVVDIGAHSTDIAVYDGDALLRACSLPVGGDHFTRDAAYGLSVAFSDAEMLKEEFGCALLGLTCDSTLIEVPSPDGRPSRETTRRQLNEILEARAEELFYYVRGELAKVGMEQSLLEGVVLTGGGALLTGMCDMAERVMNCQARNALPIGIEEWPLDIDNPGWTTAAGIAMYSARLKMKEQKRKAPGLIGLVLR